MKTLGTKIAELRRQNGMTQERFGELLGISPQSVSKWENDISMPDIMLLPLIADIFNVSVDSLFDGADTPSNIDVNEIPELVFERMLKLVGSTFGEFDFQEYRETINADNNTATASYCENGAVFGNQNIGVVYRKSSKDSAPLLENEDARELLLMLTDKNACKVLRYMAETKRSFTVQTVSAKCGMTGEEVENALLLLKHYGLASSHIVDMGEETVTVWQRHCFHRMLHIFSILTLAEFVAQRNDSYFCFRGDKNW